MTPLAHRLQLKHGRRLALIDPPAALAALADLPAAASSDEAEIVLAFAANRAALDAHLADWSHRFLSTAILWLAYPKLTSAVAADLSRDTVRAMAAAAGLDTIAQIAIDDDWSAMRVKPLG